MERSARNTNVGEKLETRIAGRPIIDMFATGNCMRETRERLGYSVADVQAMLGFANPQSVYKWERGANLPSIDNLVVLAWIYGVKMDDLVVCSSAFEVG